MLTVQTSLRRNWAEVIRKCLAWAYFGEDPNGIAHNPVCFSGDALYGTDATHSPSAFSSPSNSSGLVPIIGLTAAALPFVGPLNYIATESGANNAIVGTLGAYPAGPAQAAGLTITIKLAHTLQAGANTFAYAGNAAAAIKSHLNPANNVATAYVVGSLATLCFDGTVWQDMSQ